MDYKARTYDQIVAELAPGYAPQVTNLQNQKGLVSGQVAADIQAAQANQTKAYEDIVSGARRRGLGFSGIPLGEQAQYASTVFAPEVLRARNAGRQRELSLEEAILGIGERQATAAQSLYQQELDRQFQAEQARLAREEAARARAAAFTPSFGGGGATPTAEAANPLREAAYLDVQQRVASQDDRALISDYNATLKSANYGNAADKIKIEVYRQARPDLFRSQARQTGSYDTPLKQTTLYGGKGSSPFGQQVYIGSF